MTMPVQPPTPLNVPVQGPLPVAGQPAGNPAPLTPPPGAQLDQDVLAADREAQASETAVQQAQQRYDQLLQQFQAAQQAANDPSNINAADQLRAATSAFDTAQRDLANANTARSNAQARVQAAAEQAASREYKDPNLQAYYQGHAQQAQAQAELAKAQVQALNAKTPADVAQAQAAANQANAQAQALGILSPAQAAQANADAAQKSAQASQINALTPGLAREQAAKATTAEAGATVAPQLAQSQVAKAQTDVDMAKAQVDQLQRQIAAMPTADQAQAAINLGLQDKQADLAAKQQALQQAQALLPGAVAQQQATTAATQASTAATLSSIGQKTLGPLYGIGDQIQKLRGMIASGQIQPQDADTALNTYLNSQIQGATPFQQEQEQNRLAEAQRTQDVGLVQSRLQAGQAYAGNMANMFGQMAAGAGPGNGAAMAAGFQAALNMGRQFFGQMGGMQNPAPLQAAQQAPIHITIGGDTTSAAQPATAVTPTLPPSPPPLPQSAPVAAPASNPGAMMFGFGGSPQMPGATQGSMPQADARAITPAGPADVNSLWAGSGLPMPDGTVL